MPDGHRYGVDHGVTFQVDKGGPCVGMGGASRAPCERQTLSVFANKSRNRLGSGESLVSYWLSETTRCASRGRIARGRDDASRGRVAGDPVAGVLTTDG